MNSLLLDADVIIDANRLGFWNQLVSKNSVYIASTVLRTEALFYFDSKGKRKKIHLPVLVRRGVITELSATVYQEKSLSSKFDPSFAPRLDPGERESLCILQTRGNLLFCTFDAAAIMALGLLGIAHRGISLQKALIECGLSQNLQRKHSEQRFRSILKRAQQMRVMGQGLSEDII